MPWVSDSRTAGYLGPTSPPPLDDDPFVDFLHGLIAGITDMPAALIRPMWVEEPANQPPLSDNWCAFGVNSETFDWMPAIIHLPDGEGQDFMSRHIVSVVTVTFYGPQSQARAGLLRDGLYLHQNTAMLRDQAMGLVEVGSYSLTPELFRNNRWYSRVDVEIKIRREQTRYYPVRNLVQGGGMITTDSSTVDPVDTTFLTDTVPG